MKRSLYLSLLTLGWSVLYGQDCNLRLTGHVHRAGSHENLVAATIVQTSTGKTTASNANGDFKLDDLCPGAVTIIISHTGYDSVSRTIQLTASAHIDVDLRPGVTSLQAVSVTGSRSRTNTGFIKELSAGELDEIKGGSLGEILSRMNGVSLLQTGATISKPVIHGLHSSRILTLNNGVRHEGQQWGSEHAPEIDPYIAKRITVIKGVDELRYGSDAIGGVILVEPAPLLTLPGYKAEADALFFSNNNQFVSALLLEQQSKGLPSLTYRVQGSIKKAANVKTPDYRLNNTGLSEQNFSFTAGWRKEHFNSEIYYSRFQTELGIFSGSHIGSLADLTKAIAAARPDRTFTGENTYRIARPSQRVRHHLAKWNTQFDVASNRFTVLITGQYNSRQEYDVVRNTSIETPQIDLSLYTFTQELTWEHPRRSRWSGTVGASAMQQDNSYSGRYLLPNYRAYALGGFAIEKWVNDKWDLQAGMRADFKSMKTNRLLAGSSTLVNHQFAFPTWAASFNAGYKLSNTWKINTNVSATTRPPQVNELLTNGVHHGTGTYEIGNINLKPERSFHWSLNSVYTSPNKNWQAEVTLYRNDINDFIYQQPKPDEPVLTIRGAFPKIEYVSADALLRGMDLAVSTSLSRAIMLSSKYAMLRATNKRLDDWLIGMPADRIINELSVTVPETATLKDNKLSIDMQTVWKQSRVPSSRFGQQDYKAPPAGYHLINAVLSTTLQLAKTPVTFSLSGRNLLNHRYREYLNAFRYFTDERGRNIILKIKLELKHTSN